jgi:diguanylate cyclase (GGDEF)-like protein/PAS domain S-box-containing protein
MGRRTKTIIVILFFLVLLLALFAAGSRRLFLGSFSALEEKSMQTEVKRAKESILNELDQIDTITCDYSGWDEAYNFVQGPDRTFVKTNLADAIYSKLRLNLIVYFNAAGKITYQRLYDYHRKCDLPVPPDIISQLTPGSPLLMHTSTDSAIKGFVSTADGILLTASRPVLTSDYKGPSKGTLVMARYLDQTEIRAISERTKRSLSLIPSGVRGVSEAAEIYASLPTLQDIHVTTTSADICGYGHFHDVFGKDAFMIRVSSPRSITKQGQKTVNSFFVLFACMTLLSAGGIYAIFERLTSSLRKQRESEMQYHRLVERAAEGIVIASLEGYFILDANAAFASLTGKTLQEMRGCSLMELFDGPQTELTEEFSRILTQTRELRLHHRSGTTVTAEVNAIKITRDNKPVLSLIIHNITERKSFEDQLMYQANHDPLTGLPNRILLNDRLSHALAMAKRKQCRIVLMLLDLDHFKVINDTMGHSYGDQLLCAAAQRLGKLVRASDTIARIGGDEFVAVLTTVNDQSDVITIANRYLEEISQPYNLQGQEITLTTSIGISQFPDDGDTAETLFKKADTAMYHVKDRGRNGIQFYAEEMNIRAGKRMMIESRLRHAIELDELSLHYQPQIDLATGRIVGMEALLRWSNSELGSVAPVDFIAVAEETGLIVPLGKWALETACRQYMRWAEDEIPQLRMAVNLSPRQFIQKDLVDMVRDILAKTGIDPSCLDLEVTESLMMNNIEDSIEKMVALKKLGISLSIDDFGTGYSSLNCLQRFPLDILKIDRSFVMEIGNGSKSVIIRAIVAMAHSLGLSVVAEGVETVEQLNFLRNHRCEEVQGYYFSRPLPADSFIELITNTTDFDTQST